MADTPGLCCGFRRVAALQFGGPGVLSLAVLMLRTHKMTLFSFSPHFPFLHTSATETLSVPSYFYPAFILWLKISSFHGSSGAVKLRTSRLEWLLLPPSCRAAKGGHPEPLTQTL